MLSGERTASKILVPITNPIKDDNNLRGLTFILMTAMSSLHNLSRSLGCAIILAADKKLFIMFLGGEYVLHFVVKVLRDDFLAFFQAEGMVGVVSSFLHHLMVKIVVGERARECHPSTTKN